MYVAPLGLVGLWLFCVRWALPIVDVCRPVGACVVMVVFCVRWALPTVDLCRPVGACVVMIVFEEVWHCIEKLISLPHDGSFHRLVHTS